MNPRFSLTSLMSELFCMFFFSTTTLAQSNFLTDHFINVSKVVDVSVIPEPLNNHINSTSIESGPMLTKDGKRLYFSRFGHPLNLGGVTDQDIWYSQFDDSTQSWMEAINPGQPLNTKGPNFLCGVGWKGDTLLLGNAYGKNGKMSAGLSISVRTGDLWSFPTPVFLSMDYNLSSKVSYDLSPDRNKLIISEQKDDTYGKLDLYVAFRNADGKHKYSGTESINLGPVINSVGDETSPFLSYDGKTIYFSSNGHNGYGESDIFMSKRLDDTWTRWSKPENLGSGVNTAYNDSDFGFTPTSRYAYYSRGLTLINSDIYQIERARLFKDAKTQLEDAMEETDSTFDIAQKTVVKNVFDDDKADIKKEAMKEIQAIFNYLERYKTMTVLITAHSNKHNSRDESFSLSNKRIATIRDYLVKNGIDKSRLNYQGFGHDVLEKTNDPQVKKDVASSVEFNFVNFGR